MSSIFSSMDGFLAVNVAVFVTACPLPIEPMSRTLSSKPSATSTRVEMLNVARGFRGSFDSTVIDFCCKPFLWLLSKVTSILPSPPGGISVLVSTAAVQPHEPAALISRKGASPAFRTLNVCDTFDPWAMVPKSKLFSGKLILGPPDTLVVSVPVFTAGLEAGFATGVSAGIPVGFSTGAAVGDRFVEVGLSKFDEDFPTIAQPEIAAAITIRPPIDHTA